MTPEEAVKELVDTGVITTLPTEAGVALTLFDKVQATETRRCAAYVTSQRITDGKVADIKLARIANEILTTGGLKAEE